MTLLGWKENYRTGFDSIDFEHKSLIDGINNIFAEGDGDQEKLLTALGEIHALISAHFALEEKIMRDQRYPAYIPHKQDHERLLDEILSIMESLGKNPHLDPAATLREQLSAWFGVHFASLDKDLHAMLG